MLAEVESGRITCAELEEALFPMRAEVESDMPKVEDKGELEDLEEADAAASEDGDEGHGHDHDVQDVEGGAAEGALVEQEAVRDQLQAALAREDCREHVVEISEGLKIF